MAGSGTGRRSSIFFAFLFVALVSPLKAVVVPVELPPDIKTADDLLSQEDRIDRIVDSTLRLLDLRGVKDVVVIFTRGGKVLAPEDFGIHEVLNKRPPRDIEPERGNGWTDEEWNQVLYVWNLAYPRLKRIYGWPYCKCGGFLCLGTHKVEITKDPSIGPDGLFISRSTCWANSEIKLKGWENMYGRRWGPVLIHKVKKEVLR